MHTKRHELTDKQWGLLAPYMPKPSAKGGRPWNDHRRTINGILWKVKTGAPWRDIPERYGAWQSIYDRYSYWRKTGFWNVLMRTLQGELCKRGMLDIEKFNIDATSVRASRSAAGARKKGTRRIPQSLPIMP
jgi:transposase